MGEFFTPLFLSPLLSFFFYPSNIDFKLLNQALVLLHYYKNSPPISKSWIRVWICTNWSPLYKMTWFSREWMYRWHAFSREWFGTKTRFPRGRSQLFIHELLREPLIIEGIWISKFMRCVTLNGGPRKISRWSKGQLSPTFLLSEKFLQVLAQEEVLLSMCQNSRVISFRVNGKTQWQMFLLLYGRHVGALPRGHVAMLVPLGRAPTWRPHTKLYKFRWNSFPNNAEMKNRTDLDLGEVFCLSIIYHIPDSWLNLLNGCDFYFRCKPPIIVLTRGTLIILPTCFASH